MLFLSVLDWSGLESLGQSVDPAQCIIQKKKKNDRNKVIGRGAPAASPMPKSVLSSRERKRSTALGASLLHTFSW